MMKEKKFESESKLNMVLTFVGWLILVLGIIGGLIIAFTKVENESYYYTREVYSSLNMGIGITMIILSVLMWCVCLFMVRHLEMQEETLIKQKEQLFYLQVLTEKEKV